MNKHLYEIDKCAIDVYCFKLSIYGDELYLTTLQINLCVIFVYLPCSEIFSTRF